MVYYFDQECNRVYSAFYMVCSYVKLKGEYPEEYPDCFEDYARDMLHSGFIDIIYDDLSICYTADDFSKETYYFYNDEELPVGFHVTTPADVARPVILNYHDQTFIQEADALKLLYEFHSGDIARYGLDSVLNNCMFWNNGEWDIFDGTQTVYTVDNVHYLTLTDIDCMRGDKSRRDYVTENNLVRPLE